MVYVTGAGAEGEPDPRYMSTARTVPRVCTVAVNDSPGASAAGRIDAATNCAATVTGGDVGGTGVLVLGTDVFVGRTVATIDVAVTGAGVGAEVAPGGTVGARLETTVGAVVCATCVRSRVGAGEAFPAAPHPDKTMATPNHKARVI